MRSVPIGSSFKLSATVGAAQSIHLGSSEASGAVVFSTPAMIDLMEHAARGLLAELLEPGEESVGVRVDVEHLAASPVGALVWAVATVTARDGRHIDFALEAFDAAGIIGRGTHRRTVVVTSKLRERLIEKASSLSQGSVIPMPIEANAGDLPAMDTLQIERDGATLLVRLNRPKNANAVNVRMTGDWESLVAWLAGHAEVRVVIVTGAGDFFCGGDDIKEVETLGMAEAEALSHRQARLYLAFEQLPQVLIAAVNGAAMGAGCVCAYSCDLRIASTNATFGMPEVALGWPPGYGIAQLTAIVGKARALDLCLTGRQITAREAESMGLVHQVTPLSQLLVRARELAARLLALPAAALRETKRLVHADEGVQPKVTYLADTAAYINCLATDEAREGMAAFREKRPRRR